jgi:transglycosylase-like protein with SLT domain
MPSFLASKRSRLIAVAAAGTLGVATVATAAAATLPSATAAVTRADSSHAMTSAQRLTGFERVRFSLGERQHEHDVAVAKAAAARAAAARAAAARAASAKAAAAKAATLRRSAGTPSGSPQHIAQQMLASYGWPGSEFSCLYPLWYHESGWDPSAENPSSGAYGIPQSLPGSQMASAGADWQTNPATQIKWGLEYIQDKYGSPCAAWAHEQSSNWY